MSLIFLADLEPMQPPPPLPNQQQPSLQQIMNLLERMATRQEQMEKDLHSLKAVSVHQFLSLCNVYVMLCLCYVYVFMFFYVQSISLAYKKPSLSVA